MLYPGVVSLKIKIIDGVAFDCEFHYEMQDERDQQRRDAQPPSDFPEVREPGCTCIVISSAAILFGGVFGLIVYLPGRGTGPGGITAMLFGIGIMVASSVIALIAALAALLRQEKPWLLALILFFVPLAFVLGIFTHVIRL